MTDQTIGITGASGYVGGVLVDAFTKAGWRVVALARRPIPGAPGLSYRPYELAKPIGADTLSDLDVLVHAAYDLRAVKPDEIWSRNVEGTQRLFAAAVSAGVRQMIHTSSMSAYEGTEQVYGKAKLACESYVESVGGLSVRLGLVTGEGSGGMSGALRKIAGLPVVPLIGAKSHQYLLSESDLSRVLLAVAHEGWAPGVVSAANPHPIQFGDFMRQLAPTPRRVFVPIPWKPVHAGMRVAERLGLSLPFRSDSLLGLVRPAPGLVDLVEVTSSAVLDTR